MQRTPLRSSMIASAGHDGSDLELEFAGGAVYRYPAVPREIYDALVGADSAGKYFGAHIRGKFSATKLTPAPEPPLPGNGEPPTL